MTEEMERRVMSKYETDFYDWTVEQAALIKAGLFDQVDRENVAEEIFCLGDRWRNKLQFALEPLLGASIIYEKGEATQLSLETMKVAREQALDLLNDFPGLRRHLNTIIPLAWTHAKWIAAEDLRLKDEDLPEDCPWSAVEILQEHWLPQVRD